MTHQNPHSRNTAANTQESGPTCTRRTRCTSLSECRHSSCSNWNPSGNKPYGRQLHQLLLDVNPLTSPVHEFRSNVSQHMTWASECQLLQ